MEESESYESEENFSGDDLYLPPGIPISDDNRGRPSLEIEIPDDDEEDELDALLAVQCAFRGYLVRRCIVEEEEEESSESEGIANMPMGVPLSDDDRNEIVFDPKLHERFRRIIDNQEGTDSDIFIDPVPDSDSDTGHLEIDDPLSGLTGVDPRTEIAQTGDEVDLPLRIEDASFSGDSSYLGIGTYTGTGPLLNEETPQLSPHQIDKNLLIEIAELQEAKKRELELEKLLEESKVYLEEQRKSALQQTLYA